MLPKLCQSNGSCVRFENDRRPSDHLTDPQVLATVAGDGKVLALLAAVHGSAATPRMAPPFKKAPLKDVFFE